MRFFLICLFFFMTLSPLYSETHYTYSGHPNYPPYMWIENGKLTGLGVKLVTEILKELKITADGKAIDSWKRVQEMSKRGQVDILVGAYKNDERMTYMNYSVPYMLDPTHIFVRKDAPFSFKSVDDLIGKRGIAMYGESYGEVLDAIIKNKLTIRRVYKASAMFSNLKEGHVDYILWGYYPWFFNGKKYDASEWCKMSSKPIVTEAFYITISKKSKLLPYLPKINRIIERFKKEGKIKKWLDFYSKKHKYKD